MPQSELQINNSDFALLAHLMEARFAVSQFKLSSDFVWKYCKMEHSVMANQLADILHEPSYTPI